MQEGVCEAVVTPVARIGLVKLKITIMRHPSGMKLLATRKTNEVRLGRNNKSADNNK